MIVTLILLISLAAISLCQQNGQIVQQQNTLPTAGHHQAEHEQQQEEIILTIIVEANREECLYQTVADPKYRSFEIDYQVIEGGADADVTFSIRSPKGTVIAKDVRQADGSHKVFT